jgi:2-keto-4-pentenoate hydratase/2-oxohepta-3-ene-1,7-dioic acid hydratase in catechol pathway
MGRFFKTDRQRTLCHSVIGFYRFCQVDTHHSDQIFSVKQTIAFLSQGTTLEPGAIILTGTPKGVGFIRKPPLYLKNGDTVRVWVCSGIGSLINPVVEEGITSVSARL